MNFKQQQVYLIQQLKKKVKELGYIPSRMDMAGSYPDLLAYEQYFGSWDKALRAAGLNSSRQYVLTQKEAIAILQRAFRQLSQKGLKLSMTNYEKLMKKKHPYWSTHRILKKVLIGNYSQWNKALVKAGLIPTHYNIPTEKARQILKQASHELKQNGKPLTNKSYSDLRKQFHPDWPAIFTISVKITGKYNRGLNRILKAAGLQHDQDIRNISKEMAIQVLRKAKKEMEQTGQPFTSTTFKTYRKNHVPLIPGYDVICRTLTGHENRWSEALFHAGLSENKMTRCFKKTNKKEAIAVLKRAQKELARQNLKLTLINYDRLRKENHPEWPSVHHVCLTLGGEPSRFIQSLKAAGISTARFHSEELTPEKAKAILRQAFEELDRKNIRLTIDSYTKLKHAKHLDWPSVQILGKVLTGKTSQFTSALLQAGIPTR